MAKKTVPAKPTRAGRRRSRQAERDKVQAGIDQFREHIGEPPEARTPQARYHYTTDDQIGQLVAAREAEEPDIGFMNRVLSVCALPRKSQGTSRMYVRNTGTYELALTATNPAFGLPYGIYPRLIFAWMCTEAVRTQTPRLTLGKSLSEFLDKVGVRSSNSGGRWGVRTRFTNQMRCLFACAIHLAVTTKHPEGNRYQRYAGVIGEYEDIWWDPRDPTLPMLWTSSIELNHRLFLEIVNHAVPLDLRVLRAIRRSPLGIDLYLWLTYRSYRRVRPLRLSWKQLHKQFGAHPDSGKPGHVDEFRRSAIRELKKLKAAWPGLNWSTRRGAFVLQPSTLPVPEQEERRRVYRLPIDDQEPPR